jgi:hypothetical protein
MVVQQLRSDVPQVRAPNGVVWTRRPAGRSSAADLLRELADLGKNHIEREWDWWEDGRRDKEYDRQWAVFAEWENGAKDPAGFDPEAASKAYMEDFHRRMEEQRRAREVLAAERHDKERESLRLQMLAAEANAAFFGHVLEKPATAAQRDKAEQRMEQSRTTAAAMREQLGDPEDVVDRRGFFPADRRRMNLDSHMSVWRHPMLRGLHESKQRKRFNALLAMRAPEPAAMCSECQAPSQWHEYVISLCLFRGTPEPGSTAETIARLMPGWWKRCYASSAYQIEHVWGGSSTLPDFDGLQWAAMLPPTLRAIFAADPPKPRQPVARRKPLAVIAAGAIDDVMAKLAEAKTKFPGAVVRSGPRGGWELWPPA